MSTLSDLQQALVAADAAGDAAGAKALATHIKWLVDPNGGNYKPPANPAAQMPTPDPSAGGGTLSIGPFDTGIHTPEALDRGLAGAGQAVVNAGRGIAQLVGLESRGDVAEARKRDAPLDATTAGKVGNFVGNVGIMAVPTILTGGGAPAASFAARTGIAAGTGAGLGFLQPSTSTGETLLNTGLGTVAGGVAPAIGQGLQSLYAGGKALAEPFFKSGQDAIAARTLNAFAGSPQAARDAAAALSSAAPSVPGVAPTAGMVAGNGGVSQLQRTIAGNPDQTAAFAARSASNGNALIDAIQGIAGDPGKRQFFAADRSAAAEKLYQEAFGNYDASGVTPALQKQVDQLLSRPSINDASKQAQKLALERGEAPTAAGSLRALHDVKTVLDDKIAEAVQGNQGGQVAALKATQSKLLGLMDQLSPEYATARSTYAEMSKPINTMDVGNALLEKLSPALNDVRQAKTLNGNAFANAVRDADATAQRATGFSGARMDTVLSPADLSTVGNVRSTLGQISDSQNLGRAVGSNTAQNLVSQNLLRQIAGPLGLPESFVENTLMQSLARPVQFVGQMAQPKITNRLSAALLDPKDAGGLMLQELSRTDDPQLRNYLARALLLSGRSLPPIADEMRQGPSTFSQ